MSNGVEYRFPLVLWEQTADYQAKLKAAQARFGELAGELHKKDIRTHFPEVTFTGNCVPVVWRNDSSGYSLRGFSAADALKHATKIGATGYWSVDDVEAFVKGEGHVVETDMENLGLRRHKQIPQKWVRWQAGETNTYPFHHEHWQELYGVDTKVPDVVEGDRLRDLMPVKTVKMEPGKTYSVSVGRTGLILLALDYGNGVDTIRELGEQRIRKAHINREQKGFAIEAENVRLLNVSKSGRHDAVHVKAVRPDHVEEVVWSARMHARTIVDLATDLRDRVGSR